MVLEAESRLQRMNARNKTRPAKVFMLGGRPSQLRAVMGTEGIVRRRLPELLTVVPHTLRAEDCGNETRPAT